MTQHKISFFIRRKKHIYCRVTIGGFSKDVSTGITCHDPKTWTGRYVIDNKNKTTADNINRDIEKYASKVNDVIEKFNPQTPDIAFSLMKSSSLSEQELDKFPDTITKAAEHHIVSTKKLKGMSPHTERLYRSCLKVFKSFLEAEYQLDDIPLKAITTSCAKAYRGFLNERGYADDSKQSFMTFIKSTINMVIEDFPPDEYPQIGITFNPFQAKKIYQVKRKAKLTEFLPPQSIKTLERYHEEQLVGSDLWERSLLCLYLWNSGQSFADTCQMPEITNDLSGGKFLVYSRHKSGVRGRVLMYPELEAVYNKIRKHGFKSTHNNWLPVKNFLDEKETINLKIYGIEYALLNRFCKLHMNPIFGRNVTPHIFRHSFAVMMLDKGHSMSAVSQFMAHESISTTEKHYGFISNNRLLTEKEQILKSKSS